MRFGFVSSLLFIFFPHANIFCCHGVATRRKRKKTNLVQVEWRSNKVEDTKVDILLFLFLTYILHFDWFLYFRLYSIEVLFATRVKKKGAMQECSKRREFLKSRKARKWRHAIFKIPKIGIFFSAIECCHFDAFERS